MEKKHFSKLVIAGFFKSLTLSIAGLIDCAVVGRYLGADGLSAMKLAMPIFSVFSLFSALFSGGLSITISRELSENGAERADTVFKSAFSAICAIGVCITAFGLICPGALTELFVGPNCDPLVRSMTADYLRPLLIGALPILLYDALGTVAMLDGGTNWLKLSSAALFVVDIAGDFLAARLDRGMSGIAAASTASYIAALVLLLLHFYSRKSMIRPGVCLPDPVALRKVFLLGLPLVITLLCNIVRPMVVNRYNLAYGSIAGLAALSIQDAVRYVPGALCSGISKATLILSGIHIAESDSLALRQEKITVLRWSYIGGGVTAAVLMIHASSLLWLFTDDPDVHKLGVYALLLYLPGVPFIAINGAVSSMFQGLGQQWRSITYTVVNRLIMPILFARILAVRYGDMGIYASYTAGEFFLTVCLTAELLIKKARKHTIMPESLMNADTAADLKLNIRDSDEAVAASRQVNELCLEHGVGRKQAYLVALTAEELAMNSLSHGFDDHKEHHLELRFIITDDTLTLRLRDDGRPFDLTERYKMINPDDPASNIGLRIIFASADDVSYNSSLNLNNVCIRINRDPV